MTKPTKWLCAQQRLRSAWASAPVGVAKDQRFLHWDSEDSDQTEWMPRLVWVFAGRTCHFVGFVMRWLILCLRKLYKKQIIKIWAAAWQNEQDQRTHFTQISLGIRPVWSVFSVPMKKPWVLSCPLSTQRSRIRLGRWSELSLSANLICWFCRAAAHLYSHVYPVYLCGVSNASVVSPWISRH